VPGENCWPEATDEMLMIAGALGVSIGGASAGMSLLRSADAAAVFSMRAATKYEVPSTLPFTPFLRAFFSPLAAMPDDHHSNNVSRLYDMANGVTKEVKDNDHEMEAATASLSAWAYRRRHGAQTSGERRLNDGAGPRQARSLRARQPVLAQRSLSGAGANLHLRLTIDFSITFCSARSAKAIPSTGSKFAAATVR
jgi:hypothetical protein